MKIFLISVLASLAALSMALPGMAESADPSLSAVSKGIGPETGLPGATVEAETTRKPLAMIPLGNGPGQVGLEVENGAVLQGMFQGPMAFSVSTRGTLLVADSINNRIVSFSLPGGVHEKTLDLAAVTREARLELIPLAIDIAEVVTRDKGLRLLVGDAANNRVLVFDEAWKFVSSIGETGQEAGQFRQINRIHGDPMGKVYVEDVSLARTVCYTSDGNHFLSYAMTNLAVDAYGNLHQVLFDGDPCSRRIVIYDENGNFAEDLTKFVSVSPITYVRPVGFDGNGGLVITYDDEKARHYLTARPDGSIDNRLVASKAAEGFDLTTPEWVSGSGGINSVLATARGFAILELARP